MQPEFDLNKYFTERSIVNFVETQKVQKGVVDTPSFIDALIDISIENIKENPKNQLQKQLIFHLYRLDEQMDEEKDDEKDDEKYEVKYEKNQWKLKKKYSKERLCSMIKQQEEEQKPFRSIFRQTMREISIPFFQYIIKCFDISKLVLLLPDYENCLSFKDHSLDSQRGLKEMGRQDQFYVLFTQIAEQLKKQIRNLQTFVCPNMYFFLFNSTPCLPQFVYFLTQSYLGFSWNQHFLMYLPEGKVIYDFNTLEDKILLYYFRISKSKDSFHEIERGHLLQEKIKELWGKTDLELDMIHGAKEKYHEYLLWAWTYYVYDLDGNLRHLKNYQPFFGVQKGITLPKEIEESESWKQFDKKSRQRLNSKRIEKKKQQKKMVDSDSDIDQND